MQLIIKMRDRRTIECIIRSSDDSVLPVLDSSPLYAMFCHALVQDLVTIALRTFLVQLGGY